jgi:hypothetical protein
MSKHEAAERGKSDRSAGKQPPVAKPTPDLRNGTPGRDAHAPSASDAPAWNFSAIPISRAPVSPQPKLEVGAVNDPREREADRTADQVARMPEPSSAGAKLQRNTSAPADLSHAGAPPTVHEALRSPSRPLDPEVRAFMEPRFGHDFSQVRLHSGTAAGESARALNAHAYTLGQDIVFGSGKLAPSTKEGSRLLAHELTHVVQQGQGAQQIQRDKGSGDDPEYATGAQVEQALINYLKQAQGVQKGRFLHIDEDVRTAVLKLAGTAAVNPNDLLHMSVEKFAANVRALLPDKIPRSQMVHLYKLPEKKPVVKKTWWEKKKEKAQKTLDKVGKPPEDVRSPKGQTYPPGGEPNTGGGSKGEHDLPPQDVDTVGDWIDRKTGGPIGKNPPPSQPQETRNQDTETTDPPASTGIGRRRRDSPTGPFLHSPVPAAPTLDLGESLAESASPLMAASIGSVTIEGFVTGNAAIPRGKVGSLTSAAPIIRTLLKRYPASTIRVTGHTDAVGKEDDNQGLGQRRADSAQAFLVAQEIPTEAIRTQSAGATQLLVNTKNAEPKNRRVEILFETSTLLRDFGRPAAVLPPASDYKPK